MEARPGGKEPSTAYISEMGLPPSLLKAQQIWGRGGGRRCQVGPTPAWQTVSSKAERARLHFRERSPFGLGISRSFMNSCCLSSH